MNADPLHGYGRPGRTAVAAAALVAALCAACGREALVEPDVAATVAGEPIRVAEFEAYVEESAVAGESEVDPRVLSALLDDFLDEHLVRRLARDLGLVGADAGRREALVALMEDEGAGVPGDRRVEEFYDRHRNRFQRPERVRLRQILVEERAAAEAAAAAIDAGRPFDEVARRHSIEPAAPRGGDQGILSREDLPPAIAEVVFALEAGEVSEIVPADYGFHIFQVTERHPPEEVRLEEVAAEIRSLLGRLDRETTRARLVGTARGRYNTRVHASNLPFDYRGVFETAPASAGPPDGAPDG